MHDGTTQVSSVVPFSTLFSESVSYYAMKVLNSGEDSRIRRLWRDVVLLLMV